MENIFTQQGTESKPEVDSNPKSTPESETPKSEPSSPKTPSTEEPNSEVPVTNQSQVSTADITSLIEAISSQNSLIKELLHQRPQTQKTIASSEYNDLKELFNQMDAGK